MEKHLIKLILFILPLSGLASPNWSRDFAIKSPRENIYELPQADFQKTVMAGRKHALIYPVTVSQLRIPYDPLKNFFETSPEDPVRKFVYDLFQVVSPFHNMKEFYAWIGVHDYPKSEQPETPNPLPVLSAQEKALPMGATLFVTEEGRGLTFSCATCHVADLFGVKVLGLTNRFPRPNDFFKQAADTIPYVNSFLFKDLLHATEGERQIFVTAKEHLKFIGTKKPVVLGLDTSLAQVALSLSKRAEDEYATKDEWYVAFPRYNKLETFIADSKPAVWWNLKYKNRWLSDGSVVSGNPIHTNILWNEIGRGTDLKELEKWLKNNQKKIDELTAAVFATRAPRYEKFFGLHSLDIEKAKRGEKHFVQSCQKCHGIYEKGWSLPNADSLTNEQQVQTVRVTYHEKTPVKDVGTDPGRYLGMKEFADDLNRLKISKSIGTVVEPQVGYVPPPLEGIWSRWPYFHNNSAPNLCAVLTPGRSRPKKYYAGPALNKKTDFDQECVGYPLGNRTPSAWKNNPEYLYDSTKAGLSNKGHDEKIFMKDGVEILSKEQKSELIEFLKTL